MPRKDLLVNVRSENVVCVKKKKKKSPVISVCGRQRQHDGKQFEGSLTT